MSYSKLCDTFRASECTALGAQLGSPSLVGLDISSPVPAGLVAELIAERRPTRIEHGFCHPRLRELGRVHIADDDQSVLPNNPRGLLMKMVATGVGDLGVDRGNATLIPGALRLGERCFIFAIVLESGHRRAIAACGECLKTEINPNLSASCGQIGRDIALKGDVPATTCVLYKGTGFEHSANLSGAPEPIVSLQISYDCAVDSHSTRDKRYPAETFLCGAPAWTAADRVATRGKLAANSLYSVAVEPKIGSAARAQPDQVESGRPLARPLHGMPLDLTTIVPDLVTRVRMPN